VPTLAAADRAVGVQCPFEKHAGTVREAEPVVQRCRPVGRGAPPPRADDDAIDTHFERMPRACAVHLDRADECVTGIELRVARLEPSPGGHMPARVDGCERDRVARLDGEDRLEVGREVAVERPALERDLVQRH
jgi:hypothetical protein